MATGTADEIEEERRLFYVALTRAKDFLDVCFPLKYYAKKWSTGDRHSIAQLTRFLPESLLHHFERISLEPKRVDDGPSALPPASAEIRKKIAAMWA
jgi:DNA helicase-2/ATP-dependent DNA helicase PcrA